MKTTNELNVVTEVSNVNVEYVKWTVNTETEQFEHVGVLTFEDDVHVKILTKCGEIEVEKTDGKFEKVNREVFDSVVIKKDEEKQVVVRTDTKMSKAVDIFKREHERGTRRCDIIRLFMSELEMSKEGGGTYYQNIKKKLGM